MKYQKLSLTWLVLHRRHDRLSAVEQIALQARKALALAPKNMYAIELCAKGLFGERGQVSLKGLDSATLNEFVTD